MKEINKNNSQKLTPTKILILIISAIAILILVVLGAYVVKRKTFDDAPGAAATYSGNAMLDPEKGIIIQKENEDGTFSDVSIEEIFEQIYQADKYLKDDEESTKYEKLEYLLNAELVTKYPYISALEGDESKLNGTIKFYRYTNQLEAEEAEAEREEEEKKQEESQEDNQKGEEEQEENIFDPKEIFYIGDSWMDGLHDYIKRKVNSEYAGNDHFLFHSGHNASSPEFDTNKLKTKIDAVSSEISYIAIMLGLNGTDEKNSNAMNNIIEFLASTYPDKTVYVLKVPHVGENYNSYGINAIELNSLIDGYNSRVLEKCSEIANVKFIDTVSNLMTDDLFLHPAYKSGEYHLNDDGYNVWYNSIKECIGEGKSSADAQKFQMTYLKEEDFEKKFNECKEKEDKEIFKYFTINESDAIVVATWKKVSTTVTTNDPEVTVESLNENSSADFKEENGKFTSGKYTMMTTNLVDFNTLAEKYALPFNLLWAFLVQTGSYEFTEELANLAYESEINVGIYDNQNITIRSNKEEYNKKIRFTENTELTFPAQSQTTSSFNISDSRYNQVIKGCYGRIVNNAAQHHARMRVDMYDQSVGTRGDGGLHQYYISQITDAGIITGVTSNTEDATKFSVTTQTTTVSSANPSIGVFYVDNWMATWKASYKLEAGESNKNGNSGPREDDDYESISSSAISCGTVNTILTLHSERLKREAINGIMQNTSFSGPEEENEFREELQTKIGYRQSATAQKANTNITYETINIKNPSSYEKSDDANIENIGKKFKEIINKPEHFKSKQSILKLTNWFWEYIRSAEDTEKLEDVIRIIFNEAFDTDEFGDYDKDDIDRIFKSFEPKLRKVGMGHTQALMEWIKSFENDALRKYMNEEETPYDEIVEKYITEDREYGKMYYDGHWNFTYGIMVYSGGMEYSSEDKYYNNYKLFEKYGHDLKDIIKRLLVDGETVTVPMEDLEAIYEEIIQAHYDTIENNAKDKGVEMERYQYNALTSISYQWGNCGQYIEGENNIAEVYKKYYIDQDNPEAFRDNAVLVSGSNRLVHFFDDQYKDVNDLYKDRHDKAWIMFTEGRYILSDGEELIVSSSDSAELILEKCVEVTNDMLDNNVYYYNNSHPLVWKNIEESSDFSDGKGVCCATYVGIVLYKAGILTEDYINKYNYNLPGCEEEHYDSIYGMLKDAGWETVNPEDAQPGDIAIFCAHNYVEEDGTVVARKDHAYIYAGGDLIWDENTGCIRGENLPSGKPSQMWDDYLTSYDVVVFRAP